MFSFCTLSAEGLQKVCRRSVRPFIAHSMNVIEYVPFDTRVLAAIEHSVMDTLFTLETQNWEKSYEICEFNLPSPFTIVQFPVSLSVSPSILLPLCLSFSLSLSFSVCLALSVLLSVSLPPSLHVPLSSSFSYCAFISTYIAVSKTEIQQWNLLLPSGNIHHIYDQNKILQIQAT